MSLVQICISGGIGYWFYGKREFYQVPEIQNPIAKIFRR
jgi:hypothetical protein